MCISSIIHNTRNISVGWLRFEVRGLKLVVDTAQEIKSSIKGIFSKCDQIRKFSVDLVTFAEETLNVKLHFLCSERYLDISKPFGNIRHKDLILSVEWKWNDRKVFKYLEGERKKFSKTWKTYVFNKTLLYKKTLLLKNSFF